MQIYKYWVIEKGLVYFDRGKKEIKCYGGSNVSEADASVKAREKIEKVKNKIAGDKHAFDTYEAEIREEIVRVIDEQAIVTRNRYGAQVLNVQDVMIMDIDKPKASLLDILRRQADAKDKAKIVEQVRALSQKAIYQGCGFRIYETRNGIRVIVLGKRFDPQASATVAMMKEFNCDALYTLLCHKQACFRARLTPKPSRMKLRGYKVRFPRDVVAEQEFRQWLAGYEAASRDFSVCKFIEQIGGGDIPEAVRVHDESTGIQWGQKLA
jgi:hypothetical protein